MDKRGCNTIFGNYTSLVVRLKSQITIFTIISILLVGVIIGLILWRGELVADIIDGDMPQPQTEVRSCTEEVVYEAIEKMLPQGGYVEPSNYRLYQDDKIEYLCYNKNYYRPCINQEPMYINHLESEIHNYAKDEVEACFDSIIEEYEDRNYEINENPLSLDIVLRPGQVRINLNKTVEISKEDVSVKYKKDSYVLNSPLYSLAIVAQEIASQEAQYCNFEYLGYSLLHHQYDIEKIQVGSGQTVSSIYKIRDKATDKTLNMAVRSCAMPGGL